MSTVTGDRLADLSAAYGDMEADIEARSRAERRVYRRMNAIRIPLTHVVRAGASLSEAIELIEPRMGEYPGIYRNHLHLLAERGQTWAPADVTLASDLPGPRPEIPQAAWGEGSCYESAFLTAKHYGLKYAEGWVMHAITPEGFQNAERLVVNHAFCYDPATGGIVDTWPEPATEYVAIVFEQEQVMEAATETGLGIMAWDHDRGYDLLRRGLLGRDYSPEGT